MKKIFFPFCDQPRQLSFQFPNPIRFPFYVDDLVYYWEVNPEGAVLYLINEKINSETPTVKDIILEDTGIEIYLVNEETKAYKHIIVEFAKISKGVHTLGLLDPFTLGVIDGLTLGDISTAFANWMNMYHSIVPTSGSVNVGGSNIDMQLKHTDFLPHQKNILTGELNGEIGILSMYDQQFITLGELDPYTLNHLDAMLAIFRKFNNIPAHLVKGIKITHNNTVRNNVLAANYDKETNASNIGLSIMSGDTVDMAECLANISMRASDSYISINNGIVSLDITINDTGE